MKKWMILMLTGAALLATTVAFSSPYGNGFGRHARTHHMLQVQSRQCFHHRVNFKDVNDDGICDFQQIQSQRRAEIRDLDGDGILNGWDSAFHRSFIDQNGDGVCDHRQDSTSPSSN